MKRRTILVCLAMALMLGIGVAVAQKAPPDTARNKILVRMVAAESPDRLISDLETVASIEDPTFEAAPSRTGAKPPARPSLGDDATLWVLNASVDGTNTFERYYQGKFIKRTSELTLDLAPGAHAIEPGHHVFRVEADGTISSQDPDISIDGRTVSLKTYRIEILNVDADKSGPPETRLLGKPVGVGLILPGSNLAGELGSGIKVTNLLSQSLNFCPLRVYLPANTIGDGYLLTPCLQAFQVRPGGTIEFKSPLTPGLKADASRMFVPYITFFAWVNSRSSLTANFAGSPVPETSRGPCRIRVGPMRGAPYFWAGVEGLSQQFGLRLSGDLGLYPNKFMVADNSRKQTAVRIMTLETGGCIFERGATATARLQFKENYQALTADDIRNAQPLIDALRPGTNKTVSAAVQRVCSYVSSLQARDRQGVSLWLQATNAASRDASWKARCRS